MVTRKVATLAGVIKFMFIHNIKKIFIHGTNFRFVSVEKSQSNSQNKSLPCCVVNKLGYVYRPDTSQRQRRRFPPLPLAIALVPLKCSSRNLQFPHRVPFAKEKMPWCPCKNEAYRPAYTLFTNKALNYSPVCFCK